MSSVKSKIHGVKIDKVVDPSADIDFPLLNSLEYANDLVEKYLGKQNFLNEYLGKGANGYAYLTKRGTVYKFTRNNEEAASSLILSMFGDKLKTQIKIYKIYEVVIGVERIFIIEKEYVEPIGKYLESELNLRSFEAYKVAGIIGRLLDAEYPDYETFEITAMIAAEKVDSKTKNEINELLNNNKKLMKSVFEFHNELKNNEDAVGIPLTDNHIGNIGVKNDKVVCFDCIENSKYILKQGGMIKNKITGIKSKLSEPAKIGKLGWNKVSGNIWKKNIDNKYDSYIHHESSDYDLVIYDQTSSDKSPIDGGSFDSFEAAEKWLIKNYHNKKEDGGKMDVTDIKNLPELSIGTEDQFSDIVVKGLVNREKEKNRDVFWSSFNTVLIYLKESPNTADLLSQIEYRVVNGDNPKSVILDAIDKVDLSDKSINASPIIRLRDRIKKMEVNKFNNGGITKDLLGNPRITDQKAVDEGFLKLERMFAMDKFVDMLQQKINNYFEKEYPKSFESNQHPKVSIKEGAKYIRIDIGSSGSFMLDKSDNHLYYIKGYGVIDKKKDFGNIKDIVDNDFAFDGYSIMSKHLADKGQRTSYGYAGPIVKMENGGKSSATVAPKMNNGGDVVGEDETIKQLFPVVVDYKEQYGDITDAYLESLIEFHIKNKNLKQDQKIIYDKLSEKLNNNGIEIKKFKDGTDVGNLTKNKRYALATDMYIYAPDDNSAIKQSQDYVNDLRDRLDNQAQIIDIVEAPVGSMKTRKLENVPKYKNGGEITDEMIQWMESLKPYKKFPNNDYYHGYKNGMQEGAKAAIIRYNCIDASFGKEPFLKHGGKLDGVDIKYTRVIPRDLFNESKLLKCVGRLILLIHDNQVPVEMSFEENGDPFKIGIMDEGSLTITNLPIFIKNKQYTFKTTYNSKSNYPFYVQHDYVDYRVFDEKGEFDNEFLEFCKNAKQYKNGGKLDWEKLPEVDLGIVANDWINLWNKFTREHKLKLTLPHADPKDKGEQSDNAYFMLRHIIKIKNAGWVPDWKNENEYKYYPWFYMDKTGSGFVFRATTYVTSHTYVGLRLCFQTSKLCEDTVKEFLPIYRVYMTEN